MGYPNYPCTTCTTPSNFYSFRCIPESIDGQPPRFPALPPLHRTKSRWHCCGSSRSPGTCPAVAVIWNLNQESDRDMFWSPYKKEHLRLFDTSLCQNLGSWLLKRCKRSVVELGVHLDDLPIWQLEGSCFFISAIWPQGGAPVTKGIPTGYHWILLLSFHHQFRPGMEHYT